MKFELSLNSTKPRYKSHRCIQNESMMSSLHNPAFVLNIYQKCHLFTLRLENMTQLLTEYMQNRHFWNILWNEGQILTGLSKKEKYLIFKCKIIRRTCEAITLMCSLICIYSLIDSQQWFLEFHKNSKIPHVFFLYIKVWWNFHCCFGKILLYLNQLENGPAFPFNPW